MASGDRAVRGKQVPIYATVSARILRPKTLVLELLYTLAGATLLAAGAKIRVVAPFSPVPFTLQTMFLHYLLFIRGRKSWRCVATYIALGLAGLPLFALGGGPAYVLSPTFGYLVGFLLGAVVAGWIAPMGVLSLRRGLVAGLVQLALVYLAGVSWLACWYSLLRGLDLASAFTTAAVTGVAPFIAWDMVKLLAAISLSRITLALYWLFTKYVSRGHQ